MVSNHSSSSFGEGWKMNKYHDRKASTERPHASSRSDDSFYITNFPDYIIHSDIWRACSRFGKVCDVFISKKLFCMGKRFGFVRFSVTSGNCEKSSFDKEEVAIVLEFGNFVIDNKKLACLAKARDFNTLPSLGMLCHDEGLDDFIVRYVGGVWVIFEFKSKEACLPLRAWSKNSFRLILAKWGSIAHLDDNIREDVYKSRVCIITPFLGIISKVIKVSIDGEIFPICIKEAPGWNPTFACEFNNIDNDSVDVIHRFEQDHNSRNDSLTDREDISLDPFGIYDVATKLTVAQAAPDAVNSTIIAQATPIAVKSATRASVAVKNVTEAPDKASDTTSTTSTPFFSSNIRKRTWSQSEYKGE
ncbi:unnamed protein product [Lactuca saligna]|uniref:RRM domain-containing protein n=1 Tax=Lactuca saligna TaxID=75948 RepID=A0AA35YMG0_LACSI|nr:unnamed protein product [Lactuca saligna]